MDFKLHMTTTGDGKVVAGGVGRGGKGCGCISGDFMNLLCKEHYSIFTWDFIVLTDILYFTNRDYMKRI